VCWQVGDWEERADETEGREFQYTVSLKLPSALQSALGGFGDMTLLEKQTLERGLSSYVISTEISPQSGLIGFKQVKTRLAGLFGPAVSLCARGCLSPRTYQCLAFSEESTAFWPQKDAVAAFRAGGDVGVECATQRWVHADYQRHHRGAGGCTVGDEEFTGRHHGEPDQNGHAEVGGAGSGACVDGGQV
jgi:hypothetical protein